jgi:methylmalonyl-CoA mutase
MLRATTQALSAVLGGVQSLHVAPFDEVDSLPDEFGRRIARNVQLLLLHEVGCDRVVDPAGGSWHVERLTADVAAAAWSRFQRTEQEGGIVAGLRSGAVQQRIAAAAAERRTRLAVRRDVIVGTNRYADPAEPARTPRRADLAELVRRRAAEVAERRPDGSDVGILRNDPAAGLAADPVASGDALAVAALAGATLGDLVAVLRAGDAPAAPVTPVPARRDAEPFEQLRARVAGLRAADSRLGTVACACVGSLARTLPRLDFGRGFVQAGGFAVATGEFHADAAAAARAARATGAAVVLVVGLDEVYTEHGATLVRALKAGARPPRILLAGRPGDLEHELRDAGVDAFVHAGGDVLEILGRLVEQLEETS